MLRSKANSAALHAALSPIQEQVLRVAAEAASHTGGAMYLVGGPVRDLLLGAPSLYDLDLMTTTDARIVAAAFARDARGVVEKTTEFGTATVTVPTTDTGSVISLDFATTRTEMYPQPGALPITTFPALTVTDDLKRRDFTINAMALPLTPAGSGTLLDPFDGLSDLRAGLIRVLHDESFRDDPTRLFRGARYAARYRYAFESHTAALAERAVRDRYLSTVSPTRKRREIERGMREQDAPRCLAAFDALGLLQAASSTLVWNDHTATRIAALAERQSDTESASPSALWPLWGAFVLHEEAQGAGAVGGMERLFGDLAITETAVQTPLRLLARAFDAWHAGMITADARNSLLATYFEKVPQRIALIFFPSLVLRLHAFYDRLQAYRGMPHIRGDELQTLFGLPRGAAIGNLLAELRAAWLDELIETLEDEKGFVRGRLQK